VSVAGEVAYVTLADGRRQARSIPLPVKMLLPFAPNFYGVIRRPVFAGALKRAETMLIQGGFEGLISAEEFVALQLMMLWVFPVFWLRSAVNRRHASILKALPFVLDLLTLSVEAGMDFISALQRNCRSRRLDPLNEELLRMTKEIQVGSSRREALANMAARVGQSDLRSLALSLIQADELGVSIGTMLRIQSEQLRSRRFDRAEKLAAEAPVKMLGPLMLCIFPAVFIVLLGPIISQAMKGMW
jgi:pilus assembly protein TadC